jgi:hypothetical protein
MTQYLITIYQPDGPAPDPETMAAVERDLHALNEDLKASGSWVFTGGLCPPGSSTVVQPHDQLLIDGPYLEGKEHVGGFWVITAPDLDAALGWARRAADATTLPIEVRPFQDVAAF